MPLKALVVKFMKASYKYLKNISYLSLYWKCIHQIGFCFFLIYLVKLTSEITSTRHILWEPICFNHRLIFFTNQKTTVFFISFRIHFNKLHFSMNQFISSNLYSLFYALLIFLNISCSFVIVVLLVLIFCFYTLSHFWVSFY